MTEQQKQEVLHDWRFWARPNQLPPKGEWITWLILAGRGWGKTRCGAEWVRMRVSQGYRRVALVGETAADVRDVMIEGESGILRVCPPWDVPKYEPSKRRLTWKNGAIATAYSGDRPDMLRGPQHDSAWCDEPAKWRYGEDAWSNLMLGLRLSGLPRIVATTTPRPIPLIKNLISDKNTRTTRGNTYENLSNLSPSFRDAVVEKYHQTRLGRQEIFAEILEDAPGALWTPKLIDKNRITEPVELEDFRRIVVAIDPAATAHDESDETGMVVAALGEDKRIYVLNDLSGKFLPNEWAERALSAMEQYQADRIIAEINQGGLMVEQTLRTLSPSVSYKGIHASRGKYSRAEPVSALYEQGKVSHCGYFADLEDQMCSYEPDTSRWSPDRMDALVYAVTELALDGPRQVVVKKVMG